MSEIGAVRPSTASGGSTDMPDNAAFSEHVSNAIGTAKEQVLNKFAADQQNWQHFVDLHNKGAPVDAAKMNAARQELHNSYISVAQQQARYSGNTLHQAQRLAGGEDRFAQLGRSAGVDMTRYKVLTSDAISSGDPKRADEILKLAREVRQDYNARRDAGMVPDELLHSLSQALSSYGTQLKHAPGGPVNYDKAQVYALASTFPVNATMEERSNTMAAAAWDVPRALVSGAYYAGRSAVNLIDDAAYEVNSALDLPGLRIVDGQGKLDIGIEHDPEKMRARLPDLPEDVKPQTTGGKIAEGVVQFGTGWSAVGLVKTGAAATRIGSVARTGVQAGLTSAVAFDGKNDWRASNFVQEHLPNPVTSWLAAKPGDGALTGRLKNGVEGMLFGMALESATQALKPEASTRFQYYSLRRELRQMGPDGAGAYAKGLHANGTPEAKRDLLAATIAGPRTPAGEAVLKAFGPDYQPVDIGRFKGADGKPFAQTVDQRNALAYMLAQNPRMASKDLAQGQDMAVLSAVLYPKNARMATPPQYERVTNFSQEPRLMNEFTPADFENPATGFYAGLFRNKQDGSYTLAFRGTLTEKNWRSSIRQGVGLEDRQYKQAMRLAKKLDDALGNDLVGFTGHSQGGGQAAAAAMVTKKPAISFNAAGLHPNTIAREKGVWDENRITNYHVEGETLTHMQDQQAMTKWAMPSAVGRQIEMKPLDADGAIAGTGSISGVELHKMYNVLRALRAEQKTSSSGQ